MEETNNDFRSLVLHAFAKTKSYDTKEQIDGYRSLINFSKQKNWNV